MIDNENDTRGELFKYGERKLLSINLVYDLVLYLRRYVEYEEGRWAAYGLRGMKC